MKMELWGKQRNQKLTRLVTMLKTRAINCITKCSNQMPVVSKHKKEVFIKVILRIKTSPIIKINNREAAFIFSFKLSCPALSSILTI